MGASVGDLEQRQIERWRAEIAEVLAAELAYPPFFDFRAGRELVRPIDRAKREEIEDFVRSISFSTLDHTDSGSAEVRRFLEQLLSRFLDVNPALRHPWVMRRLPSLRARVPRLAAQIHRDLLTALSGTTTGFGAHRSQQSWAVGRAIAARGSEEAEHNTRVLEAVLARTETSHAPPAAPPQRPPEPASAGSRQPPVAAPQSSTWSGVTADAASPPTLPLALPPTSLHAAGQSPFATLATGAQSPMFGVAGGISDSPTGPLSTMPAGTAGDRGEGPGGLPPASARTLSQELYQLYGDYLRDMQPEAFGNNRPASGAPPPPHPPPSSLAWGDGRVPGAGGTQPPAAPASRSATVPPQSQAGTFPPANAGAPANPRSDQMIFFQLRYQLEAYIRRAARSYSVQTRSDDPSGVLDALRRSGYVDEADLRLAEGILAVTDRVTASGEATLQDYRQALMLYLLYHRSHLDG
jgi:hypothetical protein